MYKIIKDPKAKPFEKLKIQSSEDIYNFCKDVLYKDNDVFESAYILSIDRNMNITSYIKLGEGCTHHAVVSLKKVLFFAINTLCSRCVLIHNHPSGGRKPSVQDDTLTRDIKEALRAIKVQLIDHVIYCNDDYFSFADESLLIN